MSRRNRAFILLTTTCGAVFKSQNVVLYGLCRLVAENADITAHAVRFGLFSRVADSLVKSHSFCANRTGIIRRIVADAG
jgi:hypothetical protein